MNIEDVLLNKKNYIMGRTHILIDFATKDQILELIEFKHHLQEKRTVSTEDIHQYKKIEAKILERLPPNKRKELTLKLKKQLSMYMGTEPNETLSREIYITEKIDQLERQLNMLMERPRLYERRAEEKLSEIDDKFRMLVEISDRNTSIADNIRHVDLLEKKLSQLEADAQNMMSDISTIELGKQYLEAKNRYCAPKPKMKFSRSKTTYVRYLANIYYWILLIFKRIFHTGFFLYTGFIISLIALTFSYFVVIISNNQNTYKDLALTIPMIWLAWFFQRKINIREKLFELYNHKQKVMETYVAFKNSAYDFKASDKMEEVLLEAIKKDPSECIGKDNTTIIESVLDKLRGLFISTKTKRTIKDEIDFINNRQP